MPAYEDEYQDDLVSTLESYTRELGALCGGLEMQQIEAEGEDLDEDVDTLTSLEEMADECAALLACLEAGGHSSHEDEVELNSAGDDLDHENDHRQQPPQGKELNEQPQGLALELGSFADELKGFLLVLGESGTQEHIEGHAPPSPIIAETADLPCEVKPQTATDTNANPNVSVAPDAATAATATISDERNVVAGADEANPSHENEVFSERTKKAIALHVKRLALQKQRRHGTSNRFRISTIANAMDLETQPEQGRIPGVKVVWSKFQSSSYQKHIIRQKFARRRVKQIQDAQRLVETARLKGSAPASYRHSKPKVDKSKQHATYLDQFKPNSAHSAASSEYEPRYLCAVYLHGLHRLGTTYITFSSLAQLKQRMRARFSIEEIMSIYREVTEVVLPESALGRRKNRQRHVKRLQRISTLEQVNDGDTLCVTQNAYDDMTILCDWIKQRQRVVHDFQYQVRQSPTNESSAFIIEEPNLSKPKANGNVTTKPQLWDSNGRSIGVKAQHAI